MMMTNLFSIFDPTMSMVNLSYSIIIFLFMMVPQTFSSTSMTSYIMSKMSLTLQKEVNYSLSFAPKGVYSLVGAVFFSLVLINFMSMFPHVFSLSSHLMLTFPLSFSIWLGVIYFSWVKSFIDFLSHLVPTGTPTGLLSFMSIVELLSNFIRPMALTFRLTANMMAGHLLLSLIGGAMLTLPAMMTMASMPIQSLLVFMELGVSIIQAYVFTTLILLYVSEAK